jgi:hypothetical protein
LRPPNNNTTQYSAQPQFIYIYKMSLTELQQLEQYALGIQHFWEHSNFLNINPTEVFCSKLYGLDTNLEDSEKLKQLTEYVDWVRKVRVIECRGDKCRIKNYYFTCTSCYSTPSLTFEDWLRNFKDKYNKFDSTMDMKEHHCGNDPGHQHDSENDCDKYLDTETFQHCLDCYSEHMMDVYNSRVHPNFK